MNVGFQLWLIKVALAQMASKIAAAHKQRDHLKEDARRLNESALQLDMDADVAMVVWQQYTNVTWTKNAT
jgi:hypothetical protein